MLSYLHGFHAGNHADILKHITLIQILRHMNKKDKPYSVFDTHAGSGLYSLTGPNAKKTGEAEKGILSLALAAEKSGLPEPVDFYLKLIQPWLKNDLYPGSPFIERRLLLGACPQVLCELHPAEYDSLVFNMKDEKPAPLIKKTDGFKALSSLTPPAIKRGLALIDPAYEDDEEYDKVQQTVIQVHKKWSAGIIMIWYPLLALKKSRIQTMTEYIAGAAKAQNPNTEILNAQFMIDGGDSHIETSLNGNAAINRDTPRLYGSGVLVINPTWKLDGQLKESLSFLCRAIYRDRCPSFKTESL